MLSLLISRVSFLKKDGLFGNFRDFVRNIANVLCNCEKIYFFLNASYKNSCANPTILMWRPPKNWCLLYFLQGDICMCYSGYYCIIRSTIFAVLCCHLWEYESWWLQYMNDIFYISFPFVVKPEGTRKLLLCFMDWYDISKTPS